MRTPQDMPAPGPPRRRRAPSRRVRVFIGVIIGAFIVLLLSLRGIASFYTDYLWFDSLDYGSVWREVLVARLVLAAIFIGIFFALLWTSLFIADRLAPAFRPPGPEEELLARYHEATAGRTGLIRFGVSLFFAIVGGIGAAGQWENWILYTNRVEFGIDDPQFNTDIGFYVFQLPFLTYVVSWAFTAFIIIFIMTAIAYYVNGGIRVQTEGQRVTPEVKAHLSVLLGVLALIKAGDYWLDRYELNFSKRGFADGAFSTDVDAQLPAINLLILISLFAFVLLLVNIRRKGWVLPALAVGLWSFVAIVMGGIYPAFVQKFRVEPNEQSREIPFIERNIAATRAALGLDAVAVNSFAYNEELTASDLFDNADTVRNIRLLDPGIVPSTFEQNQAERDFYRFGTDLDVDRYEIDGVETQVVLGARQLSPADIPQPSWENQHLSYTHGYGVALSPANAVNSSGEPVFLIGGVPVENELDLALERPELYVGEALGGYAVVNTEREEIGYVDESGNVVNQNFEGEAGVEIGGVLRRSMFALRFADINLLISDPLNSDSRILYVRDIRERVEKLAPFLHYDSDPYPVIFEGRVVYILDAYTTTDRYPYGQQADTTGVPGRSGLRHSFNYVRNSVKVVVDAYDGSVEFFVIDPDDPIVQAYVQAFPALFSDIDEMPTGLIEHIRYPEDLFKVQTNMWGAYHIDQANEFYTLAGQWAVAEDPGTTVQDTNETIILDADGSPRRGARIPPYYQLLRLPDEPDEEFVLLRSFVPVSRNDDRRELVAFMVARSDPEHYGELVVYEMPGTQVDGPTLVNSNILKDEAISDRITQLNQQGSVVRLGNLLLLPIEDSILYVRPLYVEDEDEGIPELKNVIVAYADEVVIADTLRNALEDVFGQAPQTLEGAPTEDRDPDAEIEPDDEGASGESDAEDEPESEPDATPTPEPGAVAVAPAALDLFAEAFDLSQQADEALADGDLGEYQRLNAEAFDKLAEAFEIQEAGVDIGGTASGGDSAPGSTDEPVEDVEDASIEPSDEEPEPEGA